MYIVKLKRLWNWWKPICNNEGDIFSVLKCDHEKKKNFIKLKIKNFLGWKLTWEIEEDGEVRVQGSIYI